MADTGDESEHELTPTPPVDRVASARARQVLIYALVLCVLVDVIMVGMGPMFVRMEELSICRAHYFKKNPTLIDTNGNVEEALCKVDEVQAEFAFVSGWLAFFETIPGLALGLYFGRIADREGRKLVFLLNLVPLFGSAICISTVCYFYNIFPDPRILWLSPLGYLVGGGPQMLGTMYFAMVADVTPESDRAKVFVFIAMAQLIFEFVVAEGGSFLLAKNLYLPLQIGLPLTALVIPIVLFMPETLPRSKSYLGGQPRPLTDECQSLLEHLDNPTTDVCSREPRRNIFPKSRARCTHIRAILSSVPLPSWENKKNWAIFIAFFAGVLDRGTFAHVLQYMSKKFSWTIAEAGKLVSVIAAFKLAILVCVVPKIIQYLRRLRWTPESIDIFIAIASLLATAIGNTAVAICSTWKQFTVGLVISAFGCAISPILRSMATSFVPNTSVAHLYSSITVVQMSARLVVGPIFAYGFDSGLRNGILGLPFLIVAASHLCAAIIFTTFVCH